MTYTRLNPTDNVMMLRGTATDANSCTQPGLYDIRASCSNVPSGLSWCPLMVLYDGVNLSQFIVFSSTFYWRKSGSGGSWQSWYKVSGTSA